MRYADVIRNHRLHEEKKEPFNTVRSMRLYIRQTYNIKIIYKLKNIYYYTL